MQIRQSSFQVSIYNSCGQLSGFFGPWFREQMTTTDQFDPNYEEVYAHRWDLIIRYRVTNLCFLYTTQTIMVFIQAGAGYTKWTDCFYCRGHTVEFFANRHFELTVLHQMG